MWYKVYVPDLTSHSKKFYRTPPPGGFLFTMFPHQNLDLFLHVVGTCSDGARRCEAKAPPPLRDQTKCQFAFVPRDTEKSKFPDLVDFGE